MVVCRPNSQTLRPRHITLIEAKREGVKSGCTGALKPSRLSLINEVNKCSDAGTWNLGVFITH